MTKKDWLLCEHVWEKRTWKGIRNSHVCRACGVLMGRQALPEAEWAEERAPKPKKKIMIE